MGKYLYLWAVLMLTLVLPGAVYGFSATAQVDRTRISKNETILLQIISSGGAGKTDLTALTDFQVLSSSTQTSRSYINGEWKHEVTNQYLLSPLKTGELIIPALRVKGDDATVKTKEIRIFCTNTPEEKAPGRGFSARAELDTNEAVIGQQVVYTLRLYAPQTFAGAQFSPPEFKGVDVRELTKWKKTTRIIEGKAMVVNEIRFLIQGRTPGTFEIAPAVFTAQEAVRQQPRNSRDPFDSFFKDSFFNQARTRPVKVTSNPVSLKFLPLPPYDGQDRFSGLVGRFTMGAVLDKDELNAGESATLTITVQGRGNIMDLGTLAPPLDEDRFKVYPDAPVEDIRATDSGVAGKKVFSIALVPKKPGKTKIAALSLTFFDTGDMAYKTVSTPVLALNVLASAQAGPAVLNGGTASVPSAGRPRPVEKEAVTLINRDIMEIKEDISAISHASALSLPAFIFWLTFPGVLFGLFALIRGIRKKAPGIRETGMKKAKDLLNTAERLGPDHRDFPALVQSALRALILAGAGRQGEALTLKEARDLLAGAETDPETIEAVARTMERLDGARFGGASLGREEGLECLGAVRGWIKILPLVLLCTALLAPGPARASEPAALFVDGVRHYRAGAFDAAAEKFEAIAGTGVVNPDLFYDIGNARLKGGNLGLAVLWYERAARLAPEDPDIRFNLAHARSLVIDRIDTPFMLHDILFFWQGFVSLRTLQIAAIVASALFFVWAGASLARKRRVLGRTGMALMALFLVFSLAAGLEAYRLRARTHAVILSENVKVRSGTMETATPLFDLHEGTKVRVLEKKGSHIKIRIAGDKMGWVSTADAGII